MKNIDPSTGKPVDSIQLVTSATGGPRDKRFYEPDKLLIKFSDKFRFRLRRNQLIVLDSTEGLSAKLKGLLSELGDAPILRMHAVDEDRIDVWVANARKESKSKRPIGDLNNYYIILLKQPDAFTIAAHLMELDEVQFARPLFKPVPPPQAGDFTNPGPGQFQGYLQPAPGGIDAVFAWTVPGGDGTGVQICDIEYNWNFNHVDFTNNGGLVLLGNSPSDPRHDMSHGTAVVGVFGSNNDKNPGTSTVHGTTGIAFNAKKFTSAVFTYLIYNIPGAITAAMAGLSSGDILLIEQHLPGPNSSYSPAGIAGMIRKGIERGFVPVEWYEENYDAIQTAVGNGFVVVEAAGNGGEDLDADVYHPEPNGIQQLLGITPHTPFAPGHDSGAILVGAGSSVKHRRLGFSNFGRRLNVQGWGNSVVTTDAPGSTTSPDLFNGGANEQYTSTFAGTSSASPIVTGACAALQGVHRNLFGRKASPTEIRELLLRTNTVQTGDISQHIGPLPDLSISIGYLNSLFPPAPWMRDDGTFPLPFEIRIVPLSGGNSNFRDVTVWFTLDGSDPVENVSTRFTQPFKLTQPGFVTLKAKTFATNSIGARVASPETSRLYRFYVRPPAPGNLRASQGTFNDHIRLDWDSVEASPFIVPTSTYNVFAVFGSMQNPQYEKLNDQEISLITYDYRDPGLAPLAHVVFAVQAIKRSRFVGLDPPEMITEFSSPAEGWVSAGGPHLTATKGEFDDRVLVQWDAYSFGDQTGLSNEYFLYRSEQYDPSTASLLVHLEKTSVQMSIAGHLLPFPVAAATDYEDKAVTRGQTYFYWVKAKGVNPDNEVIETPLSNGDSGFARLM